MAKAHRVWSRHEASKAAAFLGVSWGPGGATTAVCTDNINIDYWADYKAKFNVEILAKDTNDNQLTATREIITNWLATLEEVWDAIVDLIKDAVETALAIAGAMVDWVAGEMVEFAREYERLVGPPTRSDTHQTGTIETAIYTLISLRVDFFTVYGQIWSMFRISQEGLRELFFFPRYWQGSSDHCGYTSLLETAHWFGRTGETYNDIKNNCGDDNWDNGMAINTAPAYDSIVIYLQSRNWYDQRFLYTGSPTDDAIETRVIDEITEYDPIVYTAEDYSDSNANMCHTVVITGYYEYDGEMYYLVVDPNYSTLIGPYLVTSSFVSDHIWSMAFTES